MKKLLLLPLLVVGFAVAGNEKADQVHTMQSLENGLSSIQKGLMYNNKDMIQTGVEEIKKHTNARGVR